VPWGQAAELANNSNVEWYENRAAHDQDIPQRVLNGFAMLYLVGSKLDEVFYDENGGVAWPQSPRQILPNPPSLENARMPATDVRAT